MPKATKQRVSAIIKARPCKCTEPGCDMAFHRPSDLARHERVHSDERPHPCPYEDCKAAFRERDRLTIHLNVHTGERPYVCPYVGCRVDYTDPASLTKHKKAKHGYIPARRDILRRPGYTARKFRRKKVTRVYEHQMRIVEFDQPTPSASTSSSAPSTALSTPVGKEQQLFPDIRDNFEGYEKPLADMVGAITFEFEPATQDNHEYTWKTPIMKEKIATSCGTAQDGFETSALFAGPSSFGATVPPSGGETLYSTPFHPFMDATTSYDDSWFPGSSCDMLLSTNLQPQFEVSVSNWEPAHWDPTVLFVNEKPLAPMDSQDFAGASMPPTSTACQAPVKQFPVVSTSATMSVEVRSGYAQAPVMNNEFFSHASQRPISTNQQQRRYQRMQMHNPYPQHQAMQPQWEYVNHPMATQSPQFQTYPSLSSQVPQPSYHHYPAYAQGGSSSTYIPSQSDLDLFKNW